MHLVGASLRACIISTVNRQYIAQLFAYSSVRKNNFENPQENPVHTIGNRASLSVGFLLATASESSTHSVLPSNHRHRADSVRASYRQVGSQLKHSVRSLCEFLPGARTIFVRTISSIVDYRLGLHSIVALLEGPLVKTLHNRPATQYRFEIRLYARIGSAIFSGFRAMINFIALCGHKPIYRLCRK